MNIIILNYSSIYRLKSKGPACLLKASIRKTVLDKQIQILNKSFKNCKITIVTGFKHKKVKNLTIKYKNIFTLENLEYENTNSLYNVGLAVENINEPVLIIPGNVLFKNNFFNKFNYSESSLFLTKDIQDIGCTINNDYIDNIMWSLPNYWTSIAYFKNKELELLKNISTQDYINKWFLFEGINWIIENGGKFKPINKNSKILTINKISDVK